MSMSWDEKFMSMTWEDKNNHIEINVNVLIWEIF